MEDPVQKIRDHIQSELNTIEMREKTLRSRLEALIQETQTVRSELASIASQDQRGKLHEALAALESTAGIPAAPEFKESKEEPADHTPGVPEIQDADQAPLWKRHNLSIHDVANLRTKQGRKRFQDPEAVEMLLLYIQEQGSVTAIDASNELGIPGPLIARWRSLFREYGLVDDSERATPKTRTKGGGRQSFVLRWTGPAAEGKNTVQESIANDPSIGKPNEQTNVVPLMRGLPVAGTGRQSVTHADFRPIFKALKKHGYAIDSTGKHYKVRDPSRKVVITISKTPSDRNALHQIVRDIERELGIKVA